MAKTVSGKEVIRRMKFGILPTSPGGYTYSAVFPNGDKITHRVMYKLLKDGKVDRPSGTNCDAQWKLIE